MKLRFMLCVMCTLLLAAFVRADEKPAGDKKADPAKIKLVKPWNKLTGLTDDQKEKIKELHSKANEEIKAIQKKETADITALLTDDQKTELKKVLEEEKMKPSGDAKKGDANKDEPKKDDPAK